MAAGAGALGVSLGGPAPYASGIRQRPTLGEGPAATAGTIDEAIGLVQRGVWLWLALTGLVAMVGILAAGGYL